MPKIDKTDPRRNETDRLFRARFSKRRAGEDAFYKVKVENPDRYLNSHARRKKQEPNNVRRAQRR